MYRKSYVGELCSDPDWPDVRQRLYQLRVRWRDTAITAVDVPETLVHLYLYVQTNKRRRCGDLCDYSAIKSCPYTRAEVLAYLSTNSTIKINFAVHWNVQAFSGNSHRILILQLLANDPIPNKLLSRGRRDNMPPPMAVPLAVVLRPSADGSAVRTPLSCRQPACL